MHNLSSVWHLWKLQCKWLLSHPVHPSAFFELSIHLCNSVIAKNLLNSCIIYNYKFLHQVRHNLTVASDFFNFFNWCPLYKLYIFSIGLGNFQWHLAFFIEFKLPLLLTSSDFLWADMLVWLEKNRFLANQFCRDQVNTKQMNGSNPFTELWIWKTWQETKIFKLLLAKQASKVILEIKI